MNVLISKQNEPFIKKILPKVKFQEASINTSIFKVSTPTFQKLYTAVKNEGYNPYALMYWSY